MTIPKQAEKNEKEKSMKGKEIKKKKRIKKESNDFATRFYCNCSFNCTCSYVNYSICVDSIRVRKTIFSIRFEQ